MKYCDATATILASESCTTSGTFKKLNMKMLATVAVRSNTFAAHQIESRIDITPITGTTDMATKSYSQVWLICFSCRLRIASNMLRRATLLLAISPMCLAR